MNHSDALAFAALFRDAYFKCFGQALENPVSETESKLLCIQVFDQTGLTIGWKSVKNYSFFVIDSKIAKPENPSVATLDTLARYVLDAPYTTEIQRKNDESHFPYWFLYKERFNKSPKNVRSKRWLLAVAVFVGGVIVIIMSLIYMKHVLISGQTEFTDNFKDVSSNSLYSKGWLVKDTDSVNWERRGDKPGQLTLFTLKGDNWPDPANKSVIKNLLLRPIPYDCFTAELHLSNFIPEQEWQQAGILLLEDTTLTGKSIRLSIAYNDFFAGSHQPKEVYIQLISSLGNGFGKPEEIAHKPVLYPDSTSKNQLLLKNFQNSALRIEKHGKRFRFLFTSGAVENTAFKEVASQEFDIQPKYIGIFAIKGFKDSTAVIPVHFTFFRIAANVCK